MEPTILSPDEVADVVEAVLPNSKVERIEVNRRGLTFPSELGIAVVFRGKGSVRFTGKTFIDIQDRVSQEIWRRGDERFPLFRFLTAEEAKGLVY